MLLTPKGEITETKIHLALSFLVARQQEQWGQILTSIANRKVSGSRSDQIWQGMGRQCCIIANLAPWLGCIDEKRKPMHAQRLHPRDTIVI